MSQNVQIPSGFVALLAISALAIVVVLMVTGSFHWYLLAIGLLAVAIIA